VARLAIGKTFLTEYGRLDKDVQGAVDAAIAKFAKHPHPGSHLEKPQRGWDDRIRTLEVDGRWRGIVLAPMTGDTYCLVTILPKDKAKAYATSHRFSVNPALGVLEVRDEEAIHHLQLLLEEAPKPDGKRLFADISDADLTRLGVDEQILPMIRLMTGEADLETRQAALPEAQYAALHALACGMTLDEARQEVARLYSTGTPPATVDPDDLVSAMERSPGQVTFVSGHEELRLILAHPFAAWRMFLHPSQRKIAYRSTYSGPVQVTGGPGTGKTVTLLHRAAFLAARVQPGVDQVLVTTFNGTLADALGIQLDLLIKDERARGRIEVLNVDRLAYRIVKTARGAPVIADERVLRTRWAKAAAAAGLDFPPAFLKNEWEQVILAQDLRTERAYLTCLRTGRGRPLTKMQRSQVWQAAQQVTAELATDRQSTHLQLANEATHLLRQTGAPRYRHILVDEAQDLHPSQWRLLRAAVAQGPDDLFIVADPHQRIYDNRVSLASMRISVRGRSQRLSLSYRTTQEVLSWAVSLLGTDPVTGLDGEVDSLLGYRSPMHGPHPRLRMAATRAEEFLQLAEQIRQWLALGIEPQAIGVTARTASLVREAREMLKSAGITTIPLSGRNNAQAVRAGTMHAMKGLEFQAVAVVGVERGLVPEPATITPASEDPVACAQDLQRERCVLFVACTRARDHLYVSGTGEPSPFLPADEPDPRSGPDGVAPGAQGDSPGPAPATAEKVGLRELLWSREDSWRPRLRSASLVVEADLRPHHTRQVAAALGSLYAKLQHPRTEGDLLLSRWPACLAAAMTGVAATADEEGSYWRALWEATRCQGTPEDEEIWGHAFSAAIGRLGMATFPGLPLASAGAIALHGGIPADCLGDYFRLLLARRRIDQGMDAESFLAWATAADRETRLAQLDQPVRRFLFNGGGYARDLVDRTLDLLDRLAEPDPDLAAVRLPGYMIEAAKEELAAGNLNLSAAGRRRPGGQGAMAAGWQARPRIVLDQHGQGVHLLLPAVEESPAGAAPWRVTADGRAHAVAGRAVGGDVAGPTPHAAFPLKPVRTVLVSLAGHEGPVAEFDVVDPSDPILFFHEDGRRLPVTVSLPRGRVWIIHPADRELEFTGRVAPIVAPTVPVGWDGWLLRLDSLESVQAVGLHGCRSHSVEVRARPRLLLDDPVIGVATPAGSPVYPVPPLLRLPRDLGASITWFAEVRRVGGGATSARRVGGQVGDIDLWDGIPRPVLGAFEITVRGPLGRGLHRTIFVAEGLSAACQPRVRPLTGAGLASATVRLAAPAGATAQPSALRFGPRERAQVIGYRTDEGAEPLVVTPPHAAVLCAGAGVPTWSTSQIHLVTENFASAGRLLIRFPPAGQPGQPGQPDGTGGSRRPELAVLVRGQRVQVIEASGQQPPGVVEFELARAADMIAAHGRADLAMEMGGALMPVGHVRPRRLALGVESIFNGPCCSLHY